MSMPYHKASSFDEAFFLKSEKMEYNSSRPELIKPEYGRVVQKMIKNLFDLKDAVAIKNYSEQIVNVMATISIQTKDSNETMQTIWEHFSEMTEGKLNLELPYIKGDNQKLKNKPNVIKYPKHKIAFKYYGSYLEELISTISSIQDSQKQEYFLKNAANFMKMQYLLWNKDSVSNELILKHVKDFAVIEVDFLERIKLNDSFEMRSKDEFARKKSKKSAKRQHNNQVNQRNKQKHKK
ncbi:MAG: DUF4290 domain-containing protein [Bacteroidia bacterium]|nr:DUF4290 domain-containing protein [Bacteroidia bacterium]